MVGFENDAKSHLVTNIVDQGLGIDEKFHATLFDPFVTTNNKPTNNESSTGLGLAIVKKIVELHHGTIGFTSEKGKGSSFYFTIPVA
jgi:signal transduction histidine kinase